MKIYAKSPRADGGEKPPILEAHTRSVCEAVEALLGARAQPTRLALALLRFFKLPSDEFEALRLNTIVAATLHDIGKANDGFQAAVGNQEFRKREQAIRHEHLSALWTAHPTIDQWLRAGSDSRLDVDVILSAIATHHLKARRDGTQTEIGFAGPMGNQPCCSAIPDGLAPILTLASVHLGKQPPGLSDFPVVWKSGSPARDELVLRADQVVNKQLRTDERRRRLLLAVRSVLIAADAAGSGLVREGQSVSAWIKAHVIDPPPLTGAYVRAEVTDKRVAQLERQGKWNRGHGCDGWSDFQVAAAGLGRRALLLAPCGAGKTLAAWRWIEAQLDRECDAGRTYSRVLFLYPTRGTATEGFRDYVSWAPEADAALVHGTAAYDLVGLFSNPEDERSAKQFTDERAARLFALAQWPKRIFSATVDAFLGAMANQYGPICLLPVLADSVVVIDEVHSFSESMFSALRCLLERFDVPVLCMTASLPNHRREALESLGLELFPRDPEYFDDLRKASGHPRYRVYAISRDDAERIAKEKLAAGKRVLWVVNRVDECQRRFRQMTGADGGTPHAPPDVPVHCYHSRFRLCDRRARHNAVVEEFQREPRRAALVIATQVCEMSLDLDADVLISEVAPVPALIQRMGRCCREKDPGERFGEVYLYEPERHLPYEEHEIQQGLTFRNILVELTALGPEDERRAVSQKDLSDYLSTLQTDVEPRRYTAFWESGFWASAQEQAFREGEEFTVDCVLRRDIDSYLSARRGRKPETPGYVVPVPRKLRPRLQSDTRLRPLMVAPDELYDVHAGYCLREVSDGQEQ